MLKNILQKKYYEHFLLLVCAVRILSHPKDCEKNNECASDLLREFVKKFNELYGLENMSYNVHSLLHIAEDVKKFGHLDSYSAFKFENFMQIMKKMVRKSVTPIQQIRNRLNEKEYHQEPKSGHMYIPIFSFSSNYPNNYCVIDEQIFKI